MRLKHRSQFQAGLSAPPVARTTHFALHKASLSEASSSLFPTSGVWFGMVIPKRQARRAVTRNTLRRQMVVAVSRWHDRLDAAVWVLRLRAGFDRDTFPSATSAALRQAVRLELDRLMARACAHPSPPAKA